MGPFHRFVTFMAAEPFTASRILHLSLRIVKVVKHAIPNSHPFIITCFPFLFCFVTFNLVPRHDIFLCTLGTHTELVWGCLGATALQYYWNNHTSQGRSYSDCFSLHSAESVVHRSLCASLYIHPKKLPIRAWSLSRRPLNRACLYVLLLHYANF